MKRIILVIMIGIFLVVMGCVAIFGCGSAKVITVKHIEMTTINGKVCQIIETTDNETYRVLNSFHPIVFKEGETYKVKTTIGSPYDCIVGGAN